MKIDSSAKTVGSGTSPSGPRAAGARPVANTGTSSAEEKAAVVSSSLNAVTGSEAAFDTKKVAEIRQAISEGRFQVDPARIADRLISSVREMLDHNRRPT
jgi:negative regulator of flagellin synthesis FlgM